MRADATELAAGERLRLEKIPGQSCRAGVLDGSSRGLSEGAARFDSPSFADSIGLQKSAATAVPPGNANRNDFSFDERAPLADCRILEALAPRELRGPDLHP